MIQLDSKRKAHVLARLRADAAVPVALWARQGLVTDPAEEVAGIARRVAASSALWELARDRHFSAGRLGCLLGVLIEARQAELLEGRSRRAIRSAWRVDPADVEAMVATLKRLAAAPGTEEVRAEFRLDAQRYASLAYSMRARDNLPHGPGRRIQARSVIETEIDLLLGERPQGERRTWTARLISDFLGVQPSTRQGITERRLVGERQRARAAARQRRRSPGATRNI